MAVAHAREIESEHSSAGQWISVPLSELMDFQNGVNAEKHAYGRGIPFINVLEVITNSHLYYAHIPGRINLTNAQIDSYRVLKGDILFNRTSETQQEIGLASVYLSEKPTVFGGFVIRGRLKDKRVHPIYSGFGFRASYVRRQIIASGQGAIRANIGQADLRKVHIFLPSFSEQEAIADTLSDADAWIESLEKLIAKKRKIKQGAMQELLTGQRRLPGFEKQKGYKKTEVGLIPEDWTVEALQKVTDCLDHLRVPLNEGERAKRKGDIPYCGANGVVDHIDDYLIDDDVILIAEDGGYFDEYATRPIAYRMTGKCWVNNHAHVLKSRAGFTQDYLFYTLVHKNLLQFIASGTRAKLNRSELNKIEIPIPSLPTEQEAIARTLNEVDTEIESLKSKLAKARKIKQGMMQELLTGRIRLV